MAKVIKNMSELKKQVDIACGKAVENACNRLLGSLQEIIDTEFYDVFEPTFYKRSMQFWRSATTKMLSQNCGQIFMDEYKMDYNDFWTGEKQIRAAAIGSHGGWVTDETKEHRFWETFITFCEEHAIDILKEELRKQHINVK